MKLLKKIAALFLHLVPLVVMAQTQTTAPTPAPDIETMQLLNNVLDWLFSILLIVAAIFIIIAGYYFVTAQGDKDTTKKARDFVLYALIGVLVAFAAKGLVRLIGYITGTPVQIPDSTQQYYLPPTTGI